MSSTTKEKIAPKISATHAGPFAFDLRKFTNKTECNDIKIIP